MIYASLVTAIALSLGSSTLAKECVGACLLADRPGDMSLMKKHGTMALKKAAWDADKKKRQQSHEATSLGFTKCINGQAGEYPCRNVNLLSFVSLADLECSGDGSDIWGWTDGTGNEYALATCESGVSFVDITNPKRPVVLGVLPTHASPSYWWDVKVYNDHAFIGSEDDYGLVVFDLSQLTYASAAFRQSDEFKAHSERDISQHGHTNSKITFTASAIYSGFSSSHNIVINEDTGFLYAVGTNTCSGGLHIVDIQSPLSPQFVGCYADDGYTHDAQCVIYSGPDTRFQGREICFAYNEDTLTIVDVEDKNDIKMLARKGYRGAAYTHQGWLDAGMEYLMLDDELDEYFSITPNGKARTHIFDVRNLLKPRRIGKFNSKETTIDHNQYIHRGISFQSNYCAGLRLTTTNQLSYGKTKEVGYFDVAPTCDTQDWLGAWSSYPFFSSGTVAVNSIDRGLFLVKPAPRLLDPVLITKPADR